MTKKTTAKVALRSPWLWRGAVETSGCDLGRLTWWRDSDGKDWMCPNQERWEIPKEAAYIRFVAAEPNSVPFEELGETLAIARTSKSTLFYISGGPGGIYVAGFPRTFQYWVEAYFSEYEGSSGSILRFWVEWK